MLELETDKVTLEVNAPAAGTLGDIVAKDGETVAPGAVLGSIVEGGAAAATAAGAKPAEAPKAEAAPPVGKGGTAAGYGSHGEAAPPAAARGAQDHGPAVARLARESGVSPAAAAASGRDGRVTKGDMLTAIAGRRRGARAGPCTGPHAPPVRAR